MDFKTLDNLSDREMALKDNGQVSYPVLLICKLVSKFLNNGPLVLAGTFTGNDLDYLAPVCSKINKQIIAVDPVYWVSDEYKQDFCEYVQNKHIDKTNVTFDWSDDSHAYGTGGDFALLIHGKQPKGSKASKAMSELRKVGITGYDHKKHGRKGLTTV